MLEEKYFPKTIKCNFSMLNITENDMGDFKKGIGTALWDCDCSYYSCNVEDISVEDDNSIFMNTVITIKKV